MKKTTQVSLASGLLIASSVAIANNDTISEANVAPMAMTDEQMDNVVGAGFEDLASTLQSANADNGLAIASAAKAAHKRPPAKKAAAKKPAAKKAAAR